ncbi:21000_t:CDS:2 [Racocetra persica]|uniref:21000_t:CDS:1 n=1 Tax=Racocetra persica TaxID=160502 RepID=A0ACA9KZ23_9GLOM|nr:21000_t:CDS:2 [Racocetra persica]
MESEDLTDKEDLDIKKKFVEADSINKKAALKFLSMPQNKYCSKLIDVQEITKRLEDKRNQDTMKNQFIVKKTVYRKNDNKSELKFVIVLIE